MCNKMTSSMGIDKVWSLVESLLSRTKATQMTDSISDSREVIRLQNELVCEVVLPSIIRRVLSFDEGGPMN